MGIVFDNIHLEHPSAKDFGDYSTNVALVYAKKLDQNPKALAENIVQEIKKDLEKDLEKVEVAGNGFINFFLSQSFFSQNLEAVFSDKEFGKGDILSHKTAIFEYTDPNPFKAFHIGHLMANAIGESLSRLAEFQAGNIKRVCYQGDIGLHVAKTVWAMKESRVMFPQDGDTEDDKIKFMGDSYVLGVNAYEDSEKAKEEIKEINKKLFDKSDADLQVYYDKGREWSLKYFDRIYKKLDTHFDSHIFESEVSDEAVKIVRENMPNIFEESEGAVVFKGEDHGLHTRVFLNSQGLPTYEAKELANTFEKVRRYKPDISIVTSANEITDYFKVIKCVLSMIDEKSGKNLHFIPHGMLRFAEGKMSSRKGNVITGESLIVETEKEVLERMKDREIPEDEKKEIATKVAISAIKYSILKQSPGKDIIFDKDKALSFEGDSGPYLLYSLVRAKAVLEKAREAGIVLKSPTSIPVNDLIRKILWFPEITKLAWLEKSPQKIVEYATELCSLFNAFYAQEKIVDSSDNLSAEKVGLVAIFENTLSSALFLLGISPVSRM